VHPLPEDCFDFPGRQLKQLSLAYFQLLKPFVLAKNLLSVIFESVDKHHFLKN
jgi:hypothetical protein